MQEDVQSNKNLHVINSHVSSFSCFTMITVNNSCVDLGFKHQRDPSSVLQIYGAWDCNPNPNFRSPVVWQLLFHNWTTPEKVASDGSNKTMHPYRLLSIWDIYRFKAIHRVKSLGRPIVGSIFNGHICPFSHDMLQFKVIMFDSIALRTAKIQFFILASEISVPDCKLPNWRPRSKPQNVVSDLCLHCWL